MKYVHAVLAIGFAIVTEDCFIASVKKLFGSMLPKIYGLFLRMINQNTNCPCDLTSSQSHLKKRIISAHIGGVKVDPGLDDGKKVRVLR